jgi:hypothetical protein
MGRIRARSAIGARKVLTRLGSDKIVSTTVSGSDRLVFRVSWIPHTCPSVSTASHRIGPRLAIGEKSAIGR